MNYLRRGRGEEQMVRIYRVDNLYDAIQIVKELEPEQIMQLYREMAFDSAEGKYKLKVKEIRKLRKYIQNLAVYDDQLHTLMRDYEMDIAKIVNKMSEEYNLKKKKSKPEKNIFRRFDNMILKFKKSS